MTVTGTQPKVATSSVFKTEKEEAKRNDFADLLASAIAISAAATSGLKYSNFYPSAKPEPTLLLPTSSFSPELMRKLNVRIAPEYAVDAIIRGTILPNAEELYGKRGSLKKWHRALAPYRLASTGFSEKTLKMVRKTRRILAKAIDGNYTPRKFEQALRYSLRSLVR